MGDLTKNFSLWEFECRDKCGTDNISPLVVTILQEDVRDHFGKAVNVNSGCRCRDRNNKTPGASPVSRHLTGHAADIWIDGVAPKEIYDHLDQTYPDRFGLILYWNRVHFDTRRKKYRKDLS